VNVRDPFYLLLAAVTAPVWLRKSRGDWGGRLGRAEPLPATNGSRRRVMLHAVSVGEVNALRSLVPLLTPEGEVVVSVTTDTGIERARALYGDTCRVVRYPLDFSRSVGRFLDAVKPDAVALVELELWPNFIGACGRRDVPVCVINGRLSERSFRGYRRVRGLMGGSFRSLAFAAVQDADYAARFEAMGVRANDCLITGSMKWDAGDAGDHADEAQRLTDEMGIDRSRPLIVAGSTGPGEEALLHAACPPGVQLLCAPRKPERYDEAAAALPGCVRRSERRAGEPGCERFLLDTMGELRGAYALADVVVIGRSFGDLHGSDPMEAAALGKPIVIGPAYGDFASVVRALEEDGAIVATSRGQLAGELASLLGDAGRRGRMGDAARACVERHRGASTRNAELVLGLVGRRGARGSPEGGS